MKCGVVCATTGAKPGFAPTQLDGRGFIFIRFPRLILWLLLMPVTTDNQFALGGESSFQFIKLTENLRSTFEPTIYFSKFTIYFSDFHIHSPDAPAHRRPLIKNPFSLFTHNSDTIALQSPHSRNEKFIRNPEITINRF